MKHVPIIDSLVRSKYYYVHSSYVAYEANNNQQFLDKESCFFQLFCQHGKVRKHCYLMKRNQSIFIFVQEELERRLDSQWKDNLKLQRKLEEVERDKNFDRQTHISTGFRLAWAIMLEQQGTFITFLIRVH